MTLSFAIGITMNLQSVLSFSPYCQHLGVNNLLPNVEWNEKIFSSMPYVREISNCYELAWGNPRDGCNARADFIARFLFRKGFPSQYLSKIILGSRNSLLNRSLEPFGHQYHIAVSVNHLVVDCLFDQNYAIPKSDWLRRQGVSDEFVRNFEQSQKLDPFPFFSRKAHDRWSSYSQDPSQEFMCTRVPIWAQAWCVSGEFRYAHVTSSDIQEFAKTLSGFVQPYPPGMQQPLYPLDPDCMHSNHVCTIL